jgi:hypothetical protein
MAWDEKAYQKEYQRKRAAKMYLDFSERRLKLFERLGNVCFICGKLAGKGFHLHHVEYHPVESDYPRDAKSMINRLRRLLEAEEHPERFALLCPYDHSAIECAKRLNKTEDFKQMAEVIYNYRLTLSL